MRVLFARSGLRLSPLQVQQFWAFHQLLRLRNDELDLTRLHSFDTIVLKHYVDCALVATLVDLPSPLLDLGSGAGFPGIPLKIVRPDVQIVLGEPRAKRVEFLREAIRELGLQDIEVVAQSVGARFEYPVRGVITRAVETIAATLARVEGWLEPGSRILFMKGPGVEPELDTARKEWAHAFRVVRDVPYTIAETPHARRLVVFERTAAPVHVDTGTGAVPVDEGAELVPSTDGRETRDILSATNPTYKTLRAALEGRGIRKHGCALVSGARAILEIVAAYPERAQAWITPGSNPPPPAGAPLGLAWYRLAPPLFQELDTIGTGAPLLLIDAPALAPWQDTDWVDGCTLFVPFQDPENVGAVIRSAAAFGVTRVVLLQEAANPFHPRSARAAGSALLRVELQRGPALADFAPQNAPVLALSPGGQDVGSVAFPDQFGLLVGLEGPGLPDTWRPTALRIPMLPGNESLNAATATAVALYAWRRTRSAPLVAQSTAYATPDRGASEV